MNKLGNLFQKGKVFTIPNLLSVFRFCLVPVIIWLSYMYYASYGKESNYYNILAVGVIVLSGITDVLDGFIARKFNMTSPLGMVIDPIADKVTQCAMIVCLIFVLGRNTGLIPFIVAFLVFFAVKELVQAFFGIKAFSNKGQTRSSVWIGKASTASIYIFMGIIILFPSTPVPLIFVMLGISSVLLTISLVTYIRAFIKMSKEK